MLCRFISPKKSSKRKLYIAVVFLLTTAMFMTGCVSTLDCAQPEVFCVGLVTGVGQLDDQAYNQAAWEGVQQAKTDNVVDWAASIETVDARDYDANIRIFANANYDVVVTVGDAMGDATRTTAGLFPNIYFIGVEQAQTEDQQISPNLVGLVFPEDQLGYLVGALATMMSQTGQIGAVCGSDEWPPMRRYGEGYRAGAAHINPDVETLVIYHNDVGLDKTFNDPEWGATTANSMIDDGIDIIFGVGGTTGSSAIVAAATRGVYSIGADTDQYYTLPIAAPRILTSVVKMIAPGIVNLVKAAKDAQTEIAIFPTGNYIGQVGLAPYHDLDAFVSDEVKARMSELSQALLTGKIETGIVITTP